MATAAEERVREEARLAAQKEAILGARSREEERLAVEAGQLEKERSALAEQMKVLQEIKEQAEKVRKGAPTHKTLQNRRLFQM